MWIPQSDTYSYETLAGSPFLPGDCCGPHLSLPEGQHVPCSLAGIHLDQRNDCSFCVFFENKIWYSVFPVTSARVSVGFPCHPCNSEWQGSTLRWCVITGWVIYGNKVRMTRGWTAQRMKQWVIFKADRFIITSIMVTVEKWMVAFKYPTAERTKNGDYARTSFEAPLGDTHKLPCRCGGPAGTCEGQHLRQWRIHTASRLWRYWQREEVSGKTSVFWLAKKKKKKALRVTDFKRKIHPKMGGGGDAVEKILNLGLGTSLAFPTLPCVRILRLCLIHILSPSYILRQAEC